MDTEKTMETTQEPKAEGKKLIQEQKLNIVKDIISEPKEKPKRRGRPKGSKNKKKLKEPEPEITFDTLKAEQEATFFLGLCETIRNGLGITKPISEFNKKCFISSYTELSKKYGDISSEYMPEIMFTGSLILIGYDTYSELKALKDDKQDHSDVREKRERKDNAN